MSYPRILFTTPVLQHPPAGGPFLRIENSIKALSRVSDLYIYSQVSFETIGGAPSLSFYRRYCKQFYFPPDPSEGFGWKLVNSLSRRILKSNSDIKDNSSKVAFRGLIKTAEAINADVIWLGYGNVSFSLLRYIKEHSSYPVVLDTDSVWSRFILRGLPFAKSPEERERIQAEGRAKEEEERRGVPLAEVTTAVSEVDEDYYRSLVKNPKRIRRFSNVIDSDAYRLVPPPQKGFSKPCVYLSGSFWTNPPMSPMVDAAHWMIQEVLPLVRRSVPDVHFYIVGAGSDTTLSGIDGPNITVTGKLASVLPYLCHANVAVVPLRFESGTRFKILEAGACGVPVVSTALGAEGIPVIHGHDILIANEPKEFADSIIKLIQDPAFALRLSDNLKQLICSQYTIGSLAAEGRGILDYVIGATRNHSTRAKL